MVSVNVLKICSAFDMIEALRKSMRKFQETNKD